MLAVEDEKFTSRLQLPERREPFSVTEQKLVTEKQQLESLYNERAKELDKREDKILQKEVHLFNQRIENYQKQTSTMGPEHFQEKLQGAQESIMILKLKVSKLESEKNGIVLEAKKREYHQQQIINSKTKEINRLTAEVNEKVKDVNLQKADVKEKNNELTNCKNIITKLKTVQKDFVHFSQREEERFTLREKIQNMKKNISHQKNGIKSALIEDLDLLETKLKSLQPPEMIKTQDMDFKVVSLEHCKSGGSSSSNSPDITTNTKRSYHRLLSKSTQTDCSLDVFWQISERENSVKDQLWYIKEKKTVLEHEEARLLKEKKRLEDKEKELNHLDGFLKREKARSCR